jgi:hypothetical protein
MHRALQRGQRPIASSQRTVRTCSASTKVHHTRAGSCQLPKYFLLLPLRLHITLIYTRMLFRQTLSQPNSIETDDLHHNHRQWDSLWTDEGRVRSGECMQGTMTISGAKLPMVVLVLTRHTEGIEAAPTAPIQLNVGLAYMDDVVAWSRYIVKVLFRAMAIRLVLFHFSSPSSSSVCIIPLRTLSPPRLLEHLIRLILCPHTFLLFKLFCDVRAEEVVGV